MSNRIHGERSTPLHSVSVAAAVVREDGRVLAIQRADNGTWEPPGGVLELDESPERGVCREVLEETGVEIEVERLTGVYKNLSRGIVALVFRCRPVGGTAQKSDEARTVAWLSPEEAADRMNEGHAVRILDACVGGAPAIRSHDGRRIIEDAPGSASFE
ncbi:NUDIX domain-containing protein [Streptomyces sp. NPDC004647]|uniref:NUDIX hydrolase n=1 Tax=Streptomyces sp. NPDC004647 TaxID=3154671 RepID=UPI0033A5D92C